MKPPADAQSCILVSPMRASRRLSFTVDIDGKPRDLPALADVCVADNKGYVILDGEYVGTVDLPEGRA